MNRESIKYQVETIRKATEKAAKSKESALKFLIDAKIVVASKDDNEAGKSVKKS